MATGLQDTSCREGAFPSLSRGLSTQPQGKPKQPPPPHTGTCLPAGPALVLDTHRPLPQDPHPSLAPGWGHSAETGPGPALQLSRTAPGGPGPRGVCPGELRLRCHTPSEPLLAEPPTFRSPLSLKVITCPQHPTLDLLSSWAPTYLEEFVQKEGEPVGQHLFCH